MKSLLLLSTMLFAGPLQAQMWNGTSTPTTTTGDGTSIQLAHIPWGSHHGILFNAKVKAVLNNGDLLSGNNIEYKYAAGPYGIGAGAILFLGAGGNMDFFVSGASTGANQPVNWTTPLMRLTRGGSVCIGTNTAGSFKLAVEGKIGAREINVTAANPWPDYVFDSEYELSSLAEIKAYIEKHKHLPEIPSAEEIEANGIDLGEMNRLLLKKIEELTLHIIKQNERIEKLEKR